MSENLHGRGVIEPVKKQQVNWKICKETLLYLMFVKQKHCGKIKARGCADRRKQQEFISKEEASPPTVSIHVLMATSLIDAIKEKHVIMADLPIAFLQADVVEDMWIKFEGEMVDVLIFINKNLYRPCVCTYKKQQFLYTKAKKAVYGCLQSALLFYKLLSDQLISWGFKMNPYDSFTINKLVEGSQLTIVFHVDDCKLSHLKTLWLRIWSTNCLINLGRKNPCQSPAERNMIILGGQWITRRREKQNFTCTIMSSRFLVRHISDT